MRASTLATVGMLAGCGPGTLLTGDPPRDGGAATDVATVTPPRATVRSARTIARAFAGAMTQPVRRYFFTRGLTGAAAAYGAAHAFELPYVFHNLGAGATADQEQLAATMGGYWTRFAATGDPNGGAAPAWPAYDVATDPYVQFGTEVTTAQGLLTARCNVWDLAAMR